MHNLGLFVFSCLCLAVVPLALGYWDLAMVAVACLVWLWLSTKGREA